MSAPLPTHTQLAFPLLEVLREHGPMSAADATQAVADRLGLSRETREARAPMPGYSKNGVGLLARRLRWVKQTHVNRGLVDSLERSTWSLTEQGRGFCHDAQPGLLLTVFETARGVCVWSDFKTAMGVLKDGSVQAVVSSPPYPILGGRAYGRFTPEACVSMLEEFFGGLRRVLTSNGSVVVNLADVWEQGQPSRSLYQEELLIKLVKTHGYFLNDRFTWINPSKPACTDWVTKRRERVRSSTEHFFWLSPTARPWADNRQVLVPYGETMRRTIIRGGDPRAPRPSGHGHAGASYAKDNGGAIPPNHFIASNASSNNEYHRFCRRMKLPIHPARFPEKDVLDFFIKFLTRPGDLVADFFGGSQLLPATAEKYGRRWFSCDRHLPYLRGGVGRFAGAEGLHVHSVPGEPKSVLLLP